MPVIDRDMGYKKLLKEISKISGGMKVYAGIRAEKGQEPVGDGDFTLAKLAATLEHGTRDGHIPARPHYGPAMDENRYVYARALRDAARKALLENGNMRLEFEKLGMKVVADIQRRIKAGVPPANAPSTIKKKGSSTPLIDTGRYWKSIDYEVTGGRK